MKLAQCISEFIFPTENHLVIRSAHEREAPGHLKVGPHLYAHHALPFFKHSSKIIDSFFAHLPLLYSALQTYSSVLSLHLSSSIYLCCSAACVRGSVFWLPIKLRKPADEQVIFIVQVIMLICVWKNVGMHAYICIHVCIDMSAHTCLPAHKRHAAVFISL